MKQLLFCILVSFPIIVSAEFNSFEINEDGEFYNEIEKTLNENANDPFFENDEEAISYEEDEESELEIDNQALTYLNE